MRAAASDTGVRGPREAGAAGGATVRLDRLLGHAGAAAPATAVGLAALALAAGTAGQALVAVRDLDEDGLCTAALAPAEARG